MQYIRTYEEFLNEGVNITRDIAKRGSRLIQQSFGVDPKQIVDMLGRNKGRIGSLVFVAPVEVSQSLTDPTTGKVPTKKGERTPNKMYPLVKLPNGDQASSIYKVATYIYAGGVDWKNVMSKDAMRNGDTFIEGTNYSGILPVPGYEGFLKEKNGKYYFQIVYQHSAGNPETTWIMYDHQLSQYRVASFQEVKPYLPSKYFAPAPQQEVWVNGAPKKYSFRGASIDNILLIKGNNTFALNDDLANRLPSEVYDIVKQDVIHL